MSIEEAEYILTEIVINEPCINGYTYISANEINQAINKILEEKTKKQEIIKKLENNNIKEINRLNNIIKSKEQEIEEYKKRNNKKSNMKFKAIIKYIKKMEKPLFLLEN